MLTAETLLELLKQKEDSWEEEGWDDRFGTIPQVVVWRNIYLGPFHVSEYVTRNLAGKVIVVTVQIDIETPVVVNVGNASGLNEMVVLERAISLMMGFDIEPYVSLVEGVRRVWDQRIQREWTPALTRVGEGQSL